MPEVPPLPAADAPVARAPGAGGAAWRRRPHALLAGLLLLHVLAHIDRNMLLGFASQITAELGLSNAQYGFLVGAVWVLSFSVMATVAGQLADRHSRPRVIGFGLIVWSACTAASGAAASFAALGLARFFVACGEAALVPAAVSMLAEVYPARRLGTALGVFFTGIPLGIGGSFLLAGHLGAWLGWRATFGLLGACGLACSLPLWWLRDRRDGAAAAAGVDRGGPDGHRGVSLAQLRGLARHVAATPGLGAVTLGFVLVHMAFAGLAFTSLWLVRERGLDAGAIARTLGALQLSCGLAGALLGGWLGDRLGARLRGGRPGFMAGLVLLCAPVALASRWPGAPLGLVDAGLACSAFLPMALYGPATSVIQALAPVHLRATITGAQMLLINVFAIALGSLALGGASDALAARGAGHPLGSVLIASDAVVLLAAACFWRAARRGRIH
ncbi:MAG: MFS transporter [Pelomonas sp.]|nr:MFS transporter [Roseateles sp.]